MGQGRRTGADDVFAKIVLRFAKAARDGNLKFDEIDPQSGDK